MAGFAEAGRSSQKNNKRLRDKLNRKYFSWKAPSDEKSTKEKNGSLIQLSNNQLLDATRARKKKESRFVFLLFFIAMLLLLLAIW